MNRHEAFDIADDFHNFIRTNNKKLIEKYRKEQIECALNMLPVCDRDKPWYGEMRSRIEALDDSMNAGRWQKSYFWDKIFPIIFAGVVSLIAGYYLNFAQVRGLKKEVQVLKTQKVLMQEEIKKAIDSRNPSEITALFDRLNNQR